MPLNITAGELQVIWEVGVDGVVVDVVVGLASGEIKGAMPDH